MDGYWQLFLATGAPEWYVLHRRTEEESCNRQKS
jgi:hypothetical protein